MKNMDNLNNSRPSRKINPSYFIYLGGIAAFGYFYKVVDNIIGGGIWFFIAAISYIICLRIIGDYIGAKINTARKS